MKPKPIYRIVFAVVVAIGSLLFLKASNQISPNKISLTKNADDKVCCVSPAETFEASNNEFIFFESVSKYLFIPFVR